MWLASRAAPDAGPPKLTRPGRGPRIWRIDPQRPDAALLARAGELIRAGGLVAFPTETVYGLGANALDAAAVRRVYAAKGRAAHDPLIVHLAGAEGLAEVAVDVPDVVPLLAARFWPGPLTLVLPKSRRVPDEVTAGLPTVAVRVPRHPVAQGLLRAAGVPIAAPSANTFMRTSATTAAHVLEDLGGRVDLILDGGPAPIGIESTVLLVRGDGTLQLLRPGAVPVEAVDAVLAGAGRPPAGRPPPSPDGPPGPTAHAPAARGAAPPPAIPGTADSPEPPGAPASSLAPETPGVPEPPLASPGQLRKHYAPRARLLYFRGPEEAARAALRAAAQEALAHGQRVGLLLYQEDAAFLADVAGDTPGVQAEALGPASDPAGVGRRLFAAMRRLDARGVDAILARGLPAGGLGLAIDDRLTRAAGGAVIQVGQHLPASRRARRSEPRGDP